jgi:ATP-binding cassette subfamily F protein 3
VFKLVAALSGGERGRLALAKLSLSKANLLLLDEPTNHLDIPSQEILQEVLADYQGTILLVAHDRYLIDALATQIWEIELDAREMRVFSGGYSAYQAERTAEKQIIEQSMGQQKSSTPVNHARQGIRQARRRAARRQQIEMEIADLESQLSQLSKKLENPPSDPVEVQNLGEDYVQCQNLIDALLAEWEQLHD